MPVNVTHFGRNQFSRSLRFPEIGLNFWFSMSVESEDSARFAPLINQHKFLRADFGRRRLNLRVNGCGGEDVMRHRPANESRGQSEYDR